MLSRTRIRWCSTSSRELLYSVKKGTLLLTEMLRSSGQYLAFVTTSGATMPFWLRSQRTSLLTIHCLLPFWSTQNQLWDLFIAHDLWETHLFHLKFGPAFRIIGLLACSPGEAAFHYHQRISLPWMACESDLQDNHDAFWCTLTIVCSCLFGRCHAITLFIKTAVYRPWIARMALHFHGYEQLGGRLSCRRFCEQNRFLAQLLLSLQH